MEKKVKVYQIYVVVYDVKRGWDLQRVGQTKAMTTEHALRNAKTKGYVAPAIGESNNV